MSFWHRHQAVICIINDCEASKAVLGELYDFCETIRKELLAEMDQIHADLDSNLQIRAGNEKLPNACAYERSKFSGEIVRLKIDYGCEDSWYLFPNSITDHVNALQNGSYIAYACDSDFSISYQTFGNVREITEPLTAFPKEGLWNNGTIFQMCIALPKAKWSEILGVSEDDLPSAMDGNEEAAKALADTPRGRIFLEPNSVTYEIEETYEDRKNPSMLVAAFFTCSADDWNYTKIEQLNAYLEELGEKLAPLGGYCFWNDSENSPQNEPGILLIDENQPEITILDIACEANRFGKVKRIRFVPAQEKPLV